MIINNNIYLMSQMAIEGSKTLRELRGRYGAREVGELLASEKGAAIGAQGTLKLARCENLRVIRIVIALTILHR